ncbi:unnamed protein product [Arctogadus glacialis]
MGVCLASCPVGYFGMRNPETNRCTQCKIENCEACFNRNFCTKCKDGFYSHRGRCHVTCPPGLTNTNGTMECTGQPVVQCELAGWSAWGSCMKKNKTCGFKKGSEARVRLPLRPGPPGDGAPPLGPGAPPPCEPQTERRKCVVVKTPCTRARGTTRVDWVWLGSPTATDTRVPDFPACKQCRASVSQSDDGPGSARRRWPAITARIRAGGGTRAIDGTTPAPERSERTVGGEGGREGEQGGREGEQGEQEEQEEPRDGRPRARPAPSPAPPPAPPSANRLHHPLLRQLTGSTTHSSVS